MESEGKYMTFSDFAKMLYPYCGNNDKTSEFVITLTNAIMEEPKEDDENHNPLSRLVVGTLEKIYSGASNISQKNAGVIQRKLYKENFLEYMAELSPDSLTALGNDLSRLGHDISEKEVGVVCADIFAQIIESIAKGVAKDLSMTVYKVDAPSFRETTLMSHKTSDDSTLHLLMEANRTCPLCGKPLVAEKDGKSLSQYKVVHILPIAPTAEEQACLGELLLTKENTDTSNNKIPLCLDCANGYLSSTSKDDCVKLLEAKDKLQRNYNALRLMDTMPLEAGIEDVLRGIVGATPEQMSDELTYTALKIKDKIPSTNVLLIIKTESYVVRYFKFIRTLFSQLEREIGLDFENVAAEVKLSYRKLKAQNLTQDEIYASFTDWFKNKANTNNIAACEVIVAFFVQNCEVFDEITQ